jgi:uncharacterized membrane protein
MKLDTHFLFRIFVWIKFIYSIFEFLAGISLIFINTQQISNFIMMVFNHELTQEPNDIFVNLVLNIVSILPESMRVFFSIFLIIHGAIKIILLFALLKRKLWAYPISGVVFSLFIVYQIYQYIISPSLILVILTIIDVILIILLFPEYKYVKRHVEKDKES